MFSSFRSATSAYRDLAATTRVTDADPHRLIELLFEGAIAAIGQARAAIGRGDLVGKLSAINSALKIVMEGLHVAVDQRRGGEIAENLDRLYEYVEMRLVQANSANDDEALVECSRILGELSEAWSAIAPSRRPAGAPAR